MDLRVSINLADFAEVIDQTAQDRERTVHHRVIDHSQIHRRKNTFFRTIRIVGAVVVLIKRIKFSRLHVPGRFKIIPQTRRQRQECRPFLRRTFGIPFPAVIGFDLRKIGQNFTRIFPEGLLSDQFRQFGKGDRPGLNVSLLQKRHDLAHGVKTELRVAFRDPDLQKFFDLLPGKPHAFRCKDFQTALVIKISQRIKEWLVVHLPDLPIASGISSAPGKEIIRFQHFLQPMRHRTGGDRFFRLVVEETRGTILFIFRIKDLDDLLKFERGVLHIKCPLHFCALLIRQETGGAVVKSQFDRVDECKHAVTLKERMSDHAARTLRLQRTIPHQMLLGTERPLKENRLMQFLFHLRRNLLDRTDFPEFRLIMLHPADTPIPTDLFPLLQQFIEKLARRAVVPFLKFMRKFLNFLFEFTLFRIFFITGSGILTGTFEPATECQMIKRPPRFQWSQHLPDSHRTVGVRVLFKRTVQPLDKCFIFNGKNALPDPCFQFIHGQGTHAVFDQDLQCVILPQTPPEFQTPHGTESSAVGSWRCCGLLTSLRSERNTLFKNNNTGINNFLIFNNGPTQRICPEVQPQIPHFLPLFLFFLIFLLTFQKSMP